MGDVILIALKYKMTLHSGMGFDFSMISNALVFNNRGVRSNYFTVVLLYF